jgi:hypothetical protein
MAASRLSTEFDCLLKAAKAAEAGELPETFADEHDRFVLYSVGLGAPALRALLVKAVEVEPDLALRQAMFVLLLEQTPHTDHGHLLRAAPDSEVLSQRSQDVGALERLLGPAEAVSDDDLAALVAGSDWLQRRVAEASDNAVLLGALFQDGRTKRVRSTSKRRLDELRQQSELDIIEGPGDMEALRSIATTGSTRKVRNAAARKLQEISAIGGAGDRAN